MHLAQYCSCIQTPTGLSDWIPVNKAESSADLKKGEWKIGGKVGKEDRKIHKTQINNRNSSQIQDAQKSY